MDLPMLFCFLFTNNFKNAYTIGTIVFVPGVPCIALNNYICDCDYNFSAEKLVAIFYFSSK